MDSLTKPISYGVGNELPDEVAAILPQDFVEHFVRSNEFVGVTDKLPRIASVLRQDFGKPTLQIQWIKPGLALKFLRFSSEERVVWGHVKSKETYELGNPQRDYGALPSQFLDYYKWLDGYQVSRVEGQPSIGWMDLPCGYGGRRELSDYARAKNLNSQLIKKIYRELNSRAIKIWMTCSTGDFFFADEFNSRGMLFHSKHNDSSAVSVVIEADFLDIYAAHILSGGAASEFDFDKCVKPLTGR